MSTQSTTLPIDIDALEPLLTTDEVAQIMRINRKSLWERRRLGKPPHATKVGGRLLWRRDEVLAVVGLLPVAEPARETNETDATDPS